MQHKVLDEYNFGITGGNKTVQALKLCVQYVPALAAICNRICMYDCCHSHSL